MNLLSTLFAIGTIPFLVGCVHTGTGQKLSVQVEVSQHTKTGWHKNELAPAKAWSLLNEVYPYATMAAAAYRYDFLSPTERLNQGCDYVESGDGDVLVKNMPHGWRRLDGGLIKRLNLDNSAAAKPLQVCKSSRGLAYETYVKLNADGRPVQAVIAFRGTENTQYQWFDDWVANFSNVDFGVGSNPQFTETREEGARVISALKQVLPKVESSVVCKLEASGATHAQSPIDLVGHSLGGGLAQHLAYSSNACDVRKAVTFDTSPANGWFYLNHSHKIKNRDPIIERFYLDGEGLSFIRKISTRFNSARNHRTDYRLTFADVKGNPFYLHGMSLLAEKIAVYTRAPFDDDPTILVDYGSKKVYDEIQSGGGAM